MNAGMTGCGAVGGKKRNARAPADTESCAAGPACPPHGPDGGADGQGNREGHRASSLVYIGEDGGGSSVESMFHSGILSMG